MSKYSQFVFESYNFNPSTKILDLNYSYDNELHFMETFLFDFDYKTYDEEALDQALQLVFFMAGVSYYKLYLASEIIIKAGKIDASLAGFLNKTYRKGLGELFYVNNLDPNTPITFPINSEEPLVRKNHSGKGKLIGIGGGKDSLLSAEILRDYPDVATWSVGHKKQLKPLVETIGLPHLWVEREWDKKLIELNKEPNTYNGHVPISAILASVGCIVAILGGYRDIVVSNESSASEPNLVFNGVEINHQYSKSLEFEISFQQQLNRLFGEDIRYYSLLRPYSEVRISELFIEKYFKKYASVFSSCNKAFRRESSRMFWCGECPKCAFVFLAFSPFLSRKDLENLFGGKNLLLNPGLNETYLQLLGVRGDKPLECVGEVKESRAAMRLAQRIYPELNSYEFSLPENYDFRLEGKHSIPEDVYSLLKPSHN